MAMFLIFVMVGRGPMGNMFPAYWQWPLLSDTGGGFYRVFSLISSLSIAALTVAFWQMRRLNRVIGRSRDRYRSLIDMSPYGMILTDNQFRIKGGNRFFAKLFNQHIKDLIGKRLQEVIALAWEAVSPGISGLRVGENLCIPPLKLSGEGGKAKWVEFQVLRHDANSLYWHISDVSEATELGQRHSELIDHLPLGIFEADISGRLKILNPAALALLGIDSMPATLDLFFPEEAWDCLVHQLRHTGEPEKGILKYTDPSGKTRFITYRAKLETKDGAFIVSGTLSDVTEEFRLQERLTHALKDAELANKAKSAFLARMSHEIRTPLNSIQGIAHLLQDKVVRQEAKDLLDDLSESSEHLASLIGDILDLSRIESGRLELHECAFNMKRMLIPLIKTFETQCRAKGLVLNTDIRLDNNACFLGDPVRIKQIFYNLIGNSLKFVEKGNITLRIYTNGKDHNGKNIIKIEVSDTGPGIDPSILPFIFDPFIQDKTGAKTGGTGLGLAITRHIAQLMDGEITVDSVLGQGTTFVVTIALETASAGEREEDDQEGLPDPTLIPKGRALIVDDVFLNRKILRLLLEKEGWRTVSAENGLEAVDILKSDREFDVILMDISMPGMDGQQATRHIKEELSIEDIPIIGISAHALNGDREKYMDSGMDGYVTKPISPSTLWAEIGRVLMKDGGDAPISRPKRSRYCSCTGQQSSQEGRSKITTGDPDSRKADSLPPPLSMDELIATCQGSRELARQLIQSLVEEIPKWVAEAERTVATKDLGGIRKICHLVRGTVSTLGASKLEEAASRLGQAAKSKEISRLPALLKHFQAEAESVRSWGISQTAKNR